jgi:hypothetical protein
MQNVGPGGIGPIRTIYCMVFPNDSSCLAEKARQVPQPGKEHTLQPPSPLGSPDLKRALGHDSIEVPSPSDPVINVEFPTNELKTLKKALAAGDCVLALSGGGGAVDGTSCATSTREAFFDVKVPPELKHILLVHDCVTSAIKLVTPLAVHGLMGATICVIEIGVELAEQPTKAPPGSLPSDSAYHNCCAGAR